MKYFGLLSLFLMLLSYDFKFAIHVLFFTLSAYHIPGGVELKRMILVDDESGQLEIMANIMLDLYPHFEVITFDNSIKALEFVRNNDADAVISDIRMPVMDGLELSEQIVKIRPDTVIAIISAYSDFEYARRAIDFGVAGYLIKPVSRSKLTELMDKIEHQIELKAENLNHIKDLNTQLESYKPVYIEKQLKDWLMGTPDNTKNELIKSIFKWNGSGLVAASKFVIQPQSPEHPFPLSDFVAFCKVHIKKLFSEGAAVLSILYDEQNMILISIIDSSGCIPLDWVMAGFEQIAEDLKSEFHVESRIGLSETADHIIDCLQTCFTQAMLALDYAFLIASPVCLAYSKVKELPSIDDTVLYTLENKILDRFRASSLSGIKEQLNTFCSTYSDGGHIAVSHKLHEHFLHIALSAKKHAQHNSNDDIITCMSNCSTIFVLANTLLDYLTGLIAYQQERNDTATRDMIESIKSYIHTNFKNDISLELIADNFHFNPSYISILFKTYSKVGFKEYLIYVRIEEAKRLLRETRLKVYEIARKTGYNDVAYFVKLFKKEVGVSPNRFRSKIF